MKNRNTLQAMRSIAGTRSRWLCAIALLAAFALAPALLASCDNGSGGGGSALDGRWINTSSTLAVNISGAAGTLTMFNPTNAAWIDAKNRGMVKVGDQYFRNLRQTGDRTWSGLSLQIEAIGSTATSVFYTDAIITLSADGRSFVRSGGVSTTSTWTRQ